MEGSMTVQGSVPLLLAVGKGLSALVILLFLAAVINVWKRGSFPSIAYGGLTLSPKRTRWVWFLVLLGAFGFGVNNEPLTTSTRTREADVIPASGTPSRTVGMTLPLPFYRFERHRTDVGGEIVREEVAESFVIPSPLLYALFAYLILVVVWNPDLGRQLRIHSIPTTLVVDPSGIVRHYHQGYGPGAGRQIQEEIEALLGP